MWSMGASIGQQYPSWALSRAGLPKTPCLFFLLQNFLAILHRIHQKINPLLHRYILHWACFNQVCSIFFFFKSFSLIFGILQITWCFLFFLRLFIYGFYELRFKLLNDSWNSFGAGFFRGFGFRRFVFVKGVRILLALKNSEIIGILISAWIHEKSFYFIIY